MADPLSTVFIAALVTGAGSEIGKRLIAEIWELFKAQGTERVLENLQKNPTPQDTRQAEEQLAAGLQRNPALATQVRSALMTEVRNNPTFADRLIQSNPKKGQSFWSLSKEHAVYKKTNRCPIGGEWIWIPNFYNAEGEQIPALSFTLLKKRVIIVECKQGHRWYVFDIQV